MKKDDFEDSFDDLFIYCNTMYCVIPIFKEPFLHPLHENNGLSALWVQPEDENHSL